MKNIIALAAGIFIGLGYGDVKATLITRGMAEITRLGTEMRCIEQTFVGLALSKQYDVEMPIVTAVDVIINHFAEPSETIKELMGRDKNMEVSKTLLDLAFGIRF